MSIEYKQYIIEDNPVFSVKVGEIGYWHKDDTDGFCSTAKSIEQAKAEINELIEENESIGYKFKAGRL